MGLNQAKLEQYYIDRQRARLLDLRKDLIEATFGKSDQDVAMRADASDEAQEYEDDAQKLAILELDSNLVAHDQLRLALVERALQKIDDGTYGQSDASGEPIPRERLEVMPEAVYTVAEQESRER